MATVAPGPDTNEAPTLIGLTSTLHLISLSTYGARIYTRSRPVLRLGWDDYFITAAVICDMVEWILLMTSAGYGLGRHNFYIAPGPAMQAEKFLFICQPPFAWALAFTKISIACMLIRIQRSRNWMIFLYLMMVLQLLTAVTINVFQFTLCNPVAAIWDTSIPGATCKSPIVGQISIYVTAAVTILTDVTFSLLPLTFIVRIQRPLREKVALSCIMGLGLIASFGSIFKTTLVKHYGITGDTLRDGIGLSIWSVMEVQLGIIAACVPCLKQLFDRVLGRLGLLSSALRSKRSGYVTYGDSQGHRLSTMCSTTQNTKLGRNSSTQSDESILPSTRGAGIKTENAQIVKTTEVSFTSETARDRAELEGDLEWQPKRAWTKEWVDTKE